eukprot:6196472-Pleurochrysis_carterae.AAC.3
MRVAGVVRLCGIEGALSDGKRPANISIEGHAALEKQQTTLRPKGVVKRLSGVSGATEGTCAHFTVSHCNRVEKIR